MWEMSISSPIRAAYMDILQHIRLMLDVMLQAAIHRALQRHGRSSITTSSGASGALHHDRSSTLLDAFNLRGKNVARMTRREARWCILTRSQETKKGNPGLQAPLQGLLISLLGTPRAWPFDQIHGQVSVAQFGDKVGWDYLPGAAFWAPDPIVMLTILHVGNAAVLCHNCNLRVGRLRTLR